MENKPNYHILLHGFDAFVRPTGCVILWLELEQCSCHRNISFIWISASMVRGTGTWVSLQAPLRFFFQQEKFTLIMVWRFSCKSVFLCFSSKKCLSLLVVNNYKVHVDALSIGISSSNI